jgi:hypothetical protein
MRWSTCHPLHHRADGIEVESGVVGWLREGQTVVEGRSCRPVHPEVGSDGIDVGLIQIAVAADADIPSE